jgi:hypothetical protein
MFSSLERGSALMQNLRSNGYEPREKRRTYKDEVDSAASRNDQQ